MVHTEKDGWISIPLTDQVKSWLSGALQNNGVALFGDDGTLYAFDDYEENGPYLLASSAVGDRALSYGKFGYKEMRNPEGKDSGSNCIAYALRDEDPIEYEHLRADKKEMARVYEQGGLDALTDYNARLVTDYVETNGAGLKISGFRVLDDFDSTIDPAKEYRIAMRMGVVPLDGVVDFEDEDADAVDFHWWLQLNDGRWAQKFPTGDSKLVPCSGPGISPGKFPWHASYFWTPKSRDYYTGKIVYFAVTKDTDEFTRHRQ
ncbi:MAG: hypothetical protein LBJ11_11835 [Oscillospiraceae bacterium]|jgi:hypothetical protein|nr:hypothetical protein [Oscillospiraceae bacterium]